MSLPPDPNTSLALSEQALTAQAAALEQLRFRVAEAQAGGGQLDMALVAEFAAAQRDFIDAKIAFERVRKAAAEAAAAAAEQAAIEAAERAAAEAAAAEAAAILAAAEAEARRQKRVRFLWQALGVVVILSLAALLWSMRGEFGLR